MNISKSDFSINESDLEGILNDTDVDEEKNKNNKKNDKIEKNSTTKNSSSTARNGRRKRPPMHTKINLDQLLEDIPLPQDLNLNPIITPKPSFSQTMTTLSPHIQPQKSSPQIPPPSPIFFQVQHDLDDYIQSSFFTLRYQITDYLVDLLESDAKYQEVMDKFLKDLKTSLNEEIVFNLKDSFAQQQYEQKYQQFITDLTNQCLSSLDQFKNVLLETSAMIYNQQSLQQQYNHSDHQSIAVSNANINQKLKEISDTSKSVTDLSSLISELEDTRQMDSSMQQRSNTKLNKLREKSLELEIQMKMLDNEIEHTKKMNEILKEMSEESDNGFNQDEDSYFQQENSHEMKDKLLRQELRILTDVVTEEKAKVSQLLISAKRNFDTECKHFMNSSNDFSQVNYFLSEKISQMPIPIKQAPRIVLIHDYDDYSDDSSYEDDIDYESETSSIDDLIRNKRSLTKIQMKATNENELEHENNFTPKPFSQKYQKKFQKQMQQEQLRSAKTSQSKTPTIRNTSLLVDFPALQQERDKELKDATEFLHQKMKAELYNIRSAYRSTRK